MAIASSQVNVTTAATLIVDGDVDWQEAQVKNTSAGTVYLGDATVTAATGYPLAQNESIDLRLNGAEKLYGIVATGSSTVGVLRKQVG